MSKKETKEQKTYTRKDLLTTFLPWIIIVVVIFMLAGTVLGWTARSTTESYIQAEAQAQLKK